MTNPTPAVVMGIIDDGLAFAHARFRYLDQTRVEFWLLQDGTVPPNATAPGRELTKGAINNLLKATRRAGTVDEDELYQRAGLIDFHRFGHNSAGWRLAHGTHVMDLAAGFDPQEKVADRPLVVVQLPARVTADTSGGDLTAYADYAIRYILGRALQIAPKYGVNTLPVVINFSYGLIAGPHDGTSRLEQLIDEHVQQSAAKGFKLRVVLPAGNTFLSRCHARVDFTAMPSPVHLKWRLMPDDRTPSYLEIWMPHRTGQRRDRIKVTIAPPGGVSDSIVDKHGTFKTWSSSPARVYAEASYVDRPTPIERGQFLIAVKPTASHNPSTVLAPSGVWTVSLENLSLAAGEIVHARIQRDDSLYGHPRRGRQSYFDNDCYARFDHAGRAVESDDDPSCPVRRGGTLNAIATGHRPVVIGGYYAKEMVATPYSAAGPASKPAAPPTTPPPVPRPGPEALAVSEDSKIHGGLLAAASRSGAVVAMGGTSVAAPQIARWIADELQAGGDGDRIAVQKLAAAHENNPPPGTPPKPAPERGGAGRIKPTQRRLKRYEA